VCDGKRGENTSHKGGVVAVLKKGKLGRRGSGDGEPGERERDGKNGMWRRSSNNHKRRERESVRKEKPMFPARGNGVIWGVKEQRNRRTRSIFQDSNKARTPRDKKQSYKRKVPKNSQLASIWGEATSAAVETPKKAGCSGAESHLVEGGEGSLVRSSMGDSQHTSRRELLKSQEKSEALKF